mgnify:CR=1 FL=1
MATSAANIPHNTILTVDNFFVFVFIKLLTFLSVYGYNLSYFALIVNLFFKQVYNHVLVLLIQNPFPTPHTAP